MRKIDINHVIDEAKFRSFHWNVLFWCTLIIIFDGYDLVIYGVVLPILMDQWQLTPIEAGSLGSIALFGMMVGAMTLGTASDKFGRKKMILLCIVLFSLFTFLCGFSQTPTQFAVMRFIAGLGIGGVMPNVVALISEYAPKKIRSTLVALMFSGYAIGGMLSAGLGIWIVPTWGWEIMFYLGCIPLILLPLIMKMLPESLGFLLRDNKDTQVKAILAKIDPQIIASNQYELVRQDVVTRKIPILDLFSEKRAISTVAFWISFFMCLLMVYALGSWLPKLMQTAGYPLKSGLMFLFAMNIGGMVGAILGGRMSDKFNLKSVLVIFFILGAIAITLLGFRSNTYFLYFLVMIAGAATIGSQILLYTYVAQYYPMHIRSTGLGWASGVGRIGAIVGPMLGGILMQLGLPHYQNFMAFAVPGIIAALAIALVGLKFYDTSKIAVKS
ncbi:aromatic acid/H+ symport family MFS transporter [Advenella sp. WQ 585]|uniref:Aromatic acid/H+ symport family MFS transporter n=1 Tax=Advenella mandrilli TaxID=2800330 RepID=A0ABS1EBW7_9BURK|nr:aromatic acid/H+ symport family MFS transporter [Advenella mandrilli]MBK1780543.1 aromatic acid/H+ symport family MFS transporter [Advenella mandrilli]